MIGPLAFKELTNEVIKLLHSKEREIKGSQGLSIMMKASIIQPNGERFLLIIRRKFYSYNLQVAILSIPVLRHWIVMIQKNIIDN